MSIWFWLFIAFWIIGMVAVPTIDAYDNRDRKTGKPRWFKGRNNGNKIKYWSKVVMAVALSWITILISIFNMI